MTIRGNIDLSDEMRKLFTDVLLSEKGKKHMQVTSLGYYKNKNGDRIIDRVLLEEIEEDLSQEE